MTTSNRMNLVVLMSVHAAVLVLLVPFVSVGQEKKEPQPPPAKKNGPPAATVEVQLSDGSTLKLQLRDERIEFETAYGKLQIPVADIQRIDFGLRMPDAVRQRIDAAIVDLGSADFRKRKVATDELLALKEKAYPSLVQASKGKDAETIRRIDELLDKIRDSVPADVLEIPPHDVVHTADSKIAGRIKGESLRVGTLAFGEQQVKLADLRTLRAPNAAEKEVATGSMLQDPGTLTGYINQVGKTFVFRVTGLAGGGVYGTDVYTSDSALAASAVHAGVLKPGQTGPVRVTILGQQPGFQASLRNGIMSNAYGPWPGFRIERTKGAAGPKN